MVSFAVSDCPRTRVALPLPSMAMAGSPWDWSTPASRSSSPGCIAATAGAETASPDAVAGQLAQLPYGQRFIRRRPRKLAVALCPDCNGVVADLHADLIPRQG